MTVSTVRGAAAPLRARAAVKPAVKPAPASTGVAPNPEVPLKAGSPALVQYYLVKAYKESRQNAAGYQASVALFGAALSEARLGKEQAGQALEAARAAAAKADEVAVVPFNAAKEAHAAAHAKFQAPVDALNKKLRQAWTELDFAVHPGRPTADGHDSEARQVRARIDALDGQIRDRYARLSGLSPYAYSYGSEATLLRDQIRDLEAQLPALFKAYVEASDKADAARGPQSDANSAAVKAAKAKVAGIEAELTEAQATYRQETDKTLLGVDKAQQTYNRAMAEYRAGAIAAERDVKAADALFAEVEKAFDAKKPRYNWFKRLGWKLFHGVDVSKVWEAERRKALNLPEPEPKKK